MTLKNKKTKHLQNDHLYSIQYCRATRKVELHSTNLIEVRPTTPRTDSRSSPFPSISTPLTSKEAYGQKSKHSWEEIVDDEEVLRTYGKTGRYGVLLPHLPRARALQG